MDTDIWRFSQYEIAPTLRLSNRVVVPAMASQTADAAGCATDATIAHYARLATSGAGLVIAEYTFVDWSGRSEPNQLGASTEAHTPGLRRIAAAIRAEGAVPGLQLTHAGGKSERALAGGRLLSPSGIVVPVKDRLLEAPEAMTMSEIENWKAAFTAAARRGVTAGFAVIEFHAAHGYGLNQWLSPLTNRRLDEYGGSLRNRARLVCEILAAVKTQFPAAILSVRLPGSEHLPGGLSTADAVKISRLFQANGASLINVSSGLGGWRRPPERQGEGYLVPEAAVIQQAIELPVIGVGGIESGAYIDRGLREGNFSFAAVGRAILSDPAAWRRHQMQEINGENFYDFECSNRIVSSRAP